MKRHRLLNVVLAVIAATVLCPATAWGISGGGTTSTPYLIASEADLRDFASKVNGSEQGAYAKLTADITLKSAWTAMGTSSKPYTGTFDGQSHKISGLSLTASAAHAGLFGYTNSATIQNFTLEGSISSGYDNTGSVVGTANGATKIHNVYSSVGITMTATKSHIGGIAGQILQASGKTAAIKGCVYSGTMNLGSSTDSNGGMVGYCGKDANVEIEYCFFNGSITSSGDNPRIGGILGYADDENSQNFKYIRYCFCDGTITPNTGDYVAIFAGYPRGNVKNVISRNYYVSTIGMSMAGNNANATAEKNKCKKISIKVEPNYYGRVEQAYIYPTDSTITKIQFTAIPNEHCHFSVWYYNAKPLMFSAHDSVIDESLFCDLGPYTAHFDPDMYKVRIKANPMGEVSLFPFNANGTHTREDECRWGHTQYVYAKNTACWEFEKWSDGIEMVSTDNGVYKGKITITENTEIIAYYKERKYYINAVSENEEYGTVTGSYYDRWGSSTHIKAIPNEGYEFVKWIEDGSTENPRYILIQQDSTFTAKFQRKKYNITVSAEAGGIVNNLGTRTYEHGTKLTLTAVPNLGYHFMQWSDGCTENPREVTATANVTYKAIFAINQPTTLPGDLNADGIISVADITLLIDILNGRSTDCHGAADVDGADGITENDIKAQIDILLKTQKP